MDSLPSRLTSSVHPPPAERADALIGAALRLQLRGRVLLLVRVVWLLILTLSLSIFVLTIPARYSQLVILGAENSIALAELGLAQTFFTGYVGTIDAIILLAYVLVGAGIYARKSDEWIGLFASLTLIASVIGIVRPADSLLFVDEPLRVPLLLLFTFGSLAVVTFTYIFPDGHFDPSWTRWIPLLLTAFAFFTLLTSSLLVQPMPWPPAPTSPIVLLGVGGGALVQVYRYRRISSLSQRRQTRWVVYGLLLGAAGLLGFLLVVPTLAPVVLRPGSARVYYILFGIPLFALAMVSLPVSLAVSILRYRLWEIDVLLSRTLVYVPLTAILAGLFAAVENVTQDLSVAVTGSQSDVATIVTTLLVVAAFTPLRELIESIVERRFKDTTPPAEKLEAFAERVRTRVTPLYAPQVLARLLAQAVAAYDAQGGAAYLTQGAETKLLRTEGAWDGEAIATVPVEREPGAARFGTIALADCTDRAGYPERDLQALRDLAALVARALEEDLAARQA